MDPEVIAVFGFLTKVLPMVVVIVAVSVGGSLLHTWLKVKNGYPLTSSWGLPLHPKKDEESAERIRLLTSENAQLRAEVGAIKDRLVTVERIVTDDSSRLAKEIDSLHLTRN
ncbi:hypothetical protein M8312_02230 [Sphingomonas sp. KRR8]|uniref:hypothetical protein n=1 Tax=Sphingomonas sp. KRR8 TaxID=2942996 RepID=UPI0020223D90|nr:hypothetical protein [Sphingomonas sp. KRR8]URD61353.1 hypothetical protein M8312_02230 [Sphingomonas sp. KRR8]